MKPKFRYRTAAETREPGYLKRRMEIYARRERMRASAQRRADEEVAHKVTTIKPRKEAKA